MPLLTAPACSPSGSCPLTPFPVSGAVCSRETSVGGINELYFIPCSSILSEANIHDIAWWTALKNAGTLGRSGIGLGSIAKKADKKERLGSCLIEQVISTTWALKFQIKTFDKTSARATTAQLNALILKANNYLLVARMCEGDDQVLPVGVFTASDFNWTVPDNFEEVQVAEIELSWRELGLPLTYDITGLSAVVPKAV